MKKLSSPPEIREEWRISIMLPLGHQPATAALRGASAQFHLRQWNVGGVRHRPNSTARYPLQSCTRLTTTIQWFKTLLVEYLLLRSRLSLTAVKQQSNKNITSGRDFTGNWENRYEGTGSTTRPIFRWKSTVQPRCKYFTTGQLQKRMLERGDLITLKDSFSKSGSVVPDIIFYH